MKFLFDFFPILCFFIAYKIHDNIFVATAVIMVASAIQIAIHWYKERRFEKMHVITLIAVLLLGGSTLFFHDSIFIKVKPTVVYWIFALILIGSQLTRGKTAMEYMLSDKITVPNKVWKNLNFSWGIFFLIMGFLNLYVVHHFSTNTWVNFKLFGTLGLMLVFVVIQSIYLAKHIEEPTANSDVDLEQE